jgi:serine/threonine protein kinase
MQQDMQISHYTIGELIGQGGMGRVFKATDTRLDRAVAFKIIDRSPVSDNWQSGFLHEAKVLASLQHPNIVTLFDMGLVDGKPFLVMEYLEGRSIQSLLQDQKELPLHQILGVGLQICLALEYAHSKGVIHRDIKPGNVLRLHDNTVKVVDFGLSITGPSLRPLPPTNRTEDLCGTYRYMSPEQRQGFAVDGQTDVYSAGLVLHELLAKQLISTDATTTDEYSSGVAEGDYLPVALGSEYCNEINSILCTALAQDRLRRYMTAHLFGCALLNLKQRVERREIVSLYERGCALVRTGVKTNDHEITVILIELDRIDPACEEKRMLMDAALQASFADGVAEVLGLISSEKRKFGDAALILKRLYMDPSLTPTQVAQLDFLASHIRTQMRNRVPAEFHGLGESSSSISRRLTAKLKSLFSRAYRQSSE